MNEIDEVASDFEEQSIKRNNNNTVAWKNFDIEHSIEYIYLISNLIEYDINKLHKWLTSLFI